MAENTERRAPIGLERLVTWKQLTDDTTDLTYDTPHPFTKSLMTVTRTPTQVQADLSADNMVVEDVTISTGGTLAIGLTGVNSEDRTLLYGNEIEAGTVVIHKDDLSPYLAVAYMTTRRDGKVNLYKFYKASFSEQAETFNSVQKGSVTFATTNIQGNYIATINRGDYGGIRMGVDPVGEADIVEKWFTDPTYIGETAGEGA